MMSIDHAITNRVLAGAGAAALLWAASMPAGAADRSGSEVVDQVCAVCHASGANGAPKIGDHKAWAAREKRGLGGLTKSALEGVRKMPPHGGKLDLSDLEISRGVTYMVNHSGGKWAEPIDRAHPPADRTGKAIVEAQCVKCHGTGVGGSPRIGDKDAWVGRARQGFDSVVRSAIAGHGGMPARGGMADLTDAEMRAAVTYMFQTSVKDWNK